MVQLSVFLVALLLIGIAVFLLLLDRQRLTQGHARTLAEVDTSLKKERERVTRLETENRAWRGLAENLALLIDPTAGESPHGEAVSEEGAMGLALLDASADEARRRLARHAKTLKLSTDPDALIPSLARAALQDWPLTCPACDGPATIDPIGALWSCKTCRVLRLTHVLFGRPQFLAPRVSVERVAADASAGTPIDALAAHYGLDPFDVQRAITYVERSKSR